MKDISLWPNNSIFVSSDHKTEHQKSSSLSRWAFAKGQVGFCVPFLEEWHPPRSVYMVPSSVQWTVCLETLPPAEPRYTRIALVVILWFFFTSLAILVASTGVTFGFRPRPLKFSTVWNVLYFFFSFLNIFWAFLLIGQLKTWTGNRMRERGRDTQQRDPGREHQMATVHGHSTNKCI